MKLAVFSHKLCWNSQHSPTGYATDGGFPFQVQALSQLFDETIAALPITTKTAGKGGAPLAGTNLRVIPLQAPAGRGLRRKLAMLVWLVKHAPLLRDTVRQADAVHVPIPGDVGTFGLILALMERKPLFVRHCGNWLRPVTIAEHFWKWLMESTAGGRNVMMATGGGNERPSSRNRNIDWIFSTSLSQTELASCQKHREWPGNERLRLAIACRQDVEKGTGVVIDSLPILRSTVRGIRLDVIGDGRDLEMFKSRSEALGVSDLITFHGKVPQRDVIRLLKSADLFCYPTAASEGFPKVVIEAMACGLPIVTTPVSVLPHLIQRGCGVVLSERTPEHVAAAVRDCSADQSRYENLSRRAAEVASEYSLERWKSTIGQSLERAWQCRLRCDS